MTCYHPILSGYDEINKRIHFGRPYKDDDRIIGCYNVPIDCGKCIGCQFKYRSGWIVRIMSQLYENILNGCGSASFVTLTYDKEHLPYNADLFYDDVKVFMKAVRHFYKNVYGIKDIKFLCCGEYGVNRGDSVYGDSYHGRPHYHLIMLGCNFREYFQLSFMHHNKCMKSILDRAKNYEFDGKKCDDAPATIMPYRDKHMIETHGTTAFRSPLVERLWKRGVCAIGNVTAESVGYVAGYNVKQKMLVFESQEVKQEFYSRNGENLKMPFIQPSRNLGKSFFDKYYKDIYKSGVVRLPNIFGKYYPIPRVYNKWCEKYYPEYYAIVKENRRKYFETVEKDTPERLADKEELKKISASKLVRRLDDIGSLEAVLNELPVVCSQASSGIVNLV